MVGGRGLEVCGSGGGCPRLPIPNSPCACGLVNDGVGGEGGGRGGGTEFRNCAEVKVAALDSPFLTVLVVAGDMKQH